MVNNEERLQASTAMYFRPSLFWDVKRRKNEGLFNNDSDRQSYLAASQIVPALTTCLLLKSSYLYD